MQGFTLINGVYVENTIFSVEFACDYDKCKGACCYAEVDGIELDGGSLSPQEAIDVRKYKKTLSYFCDKSRAQQVATRPVYSNGGKWYVSLNDDGECVLLNMRRGTCACKLAHKAGTFPFDIPVACQLYPIVFHTADGDRFLTLQNTFEEMCECGYEKGEQEHIKVYEFCKEALIKSFGEDFYRALDAHAKSL